LRLGQSLREPAHGSARRLKDKSYLHATAYHPCRRRYLYLIAAFAGTPMLKENHQLRFWVRYILARNWRSSEAQVTASRYSPHKRMPSSQAKGYTSCRGLFGSTPTSAPGCGLTIHA
jgi:hypothetical protein